MLSTLKLYALGAVGLVLLALVGSLWYYHGKAQRLASELADEKAYSQSMEKGYAALSDRYAEQKTEAKQTSEELNVISKSPDAGPVPNVLRCVIGVCK